MWQVILLVVGVVMATIGTVMIYDARILTKRIFNSNWWSIIGVLSILTLSFSNAKVNYKSKFVKLKS